MLSTVLGRIPCKVLLAVTVACLWIGEVYPFSNFPMFGSFSGKTYYVYLADGKGTPIPAMDYGVPTNGIKKAYDASLKKLQKAQGKKDLSTQSRVAAEETLRYLLQKRKKTPANGSALQLIRVDLRMKDGELIKEIQVAGEVPLP